MRFELFALSALAPFSSCLVISPVNEILRRLVARGIGSSSPAEPEAAPQRNVWVQLETPIASRDPSVAGSQIGSGFSQAALESGDVSTMVSAASVYIQGDGGSNGGLLIRLTMSFIGTDGMTVQALDFGLQNSMDAPINRISPDKSSVISVHDAGTVQIDNDRLLDTTGKGILTDIWSADTNYRTWTNGPLNLIAYVLRNIGAQPTEEISTVLRNIGINARLRGDSSLEVTAENVPVQLIKATAKGIELTDLDAWTFDVQDGENPQLIEQLKGGAPVEPGISPPPKQSISARFNGITKQFSDWSGLSDCLSGPCFGGSNEAGPGYESVPVSEFDAEAAATDAAIAEAFDDGDPGPSTSRLEPISEEIQPDEDCTEPASCAGKGGEGEDQRLSVSGDTQVAVIRTGGTFAMVTSFTTGALNVLGVAGVAVAALYIILDIVLGQFKAAAFGATGITLGIGAAMVISGPIGILIGAAVAALFFILPGVLVSTPSLAPSNNKTEILQYAFFGHRDHTGNEACNKQRVAAGLAPNCTVVYGAGVISQILNLDIFDAIVFLIEYNQGHAMSIPDIAEAFQVKDYTINNWGTNVTATIDCEKYMPPLPPQRGTVNPHKKISQIESPSKGYPCRNASFAINRSLINIPVINQTADKVYSRIIPAPGGDCKLLSDPSGGLDIPVLGLTITGRAVAIACNLTAADMNGTDISPTLNYFNNVPSNITNSTTYSGTQLIQINSTSNSSGQNIPLNSTTHLPSNSTESDNGIVTSDGSYNRAYEPAPPPSAFIAYNDSNSACLFSPTGSICLPNGTYAFMNGTLGFSTLGTSVLKLPTLGSISFVVPGSFLPSKDPGNFYEASIGDQLQTVPETYFQNITLLNHDFTSQMSFLTTYMDGAPKNMPHNTTFVIHVPSNNIPPGVCLHASPQFLGDTVCFGLGGGNLTGLILGKAQSLSLRGNASAWIYAEAYNDLGGAFVSTDVPDLEELPYGSDGNFKGNVKAMWVKPPE